jgi:hypothetical protein
LRARRIGGEILVLRNHHRFPATERKTASLRNDPRIASTMSDRLRLANTEALFAGSGWKTKISPTIESSFFHGLAITIFKVA